ncbi:DUF5416 family protein [Campylobacter hyointestinalis]|uniref:Membrane fusion protein n=1 Tax=Campylobacter hyointestinalis subsp. hyointestinalis TaxID=91352 RepID=A0A9W5F0U9_CAMHY|nr:DUF5416 family protein [Campylobacter hyointestinalis]PPB53140.1 hypothetical protein CDQ68_00175 [Campylobacter hyointestinalis subsp. hyointestinalis]PPB62421.1 hypothetical protein CDQ72_02675 [Campylobacter hyointestinalis subsp. hyointestinalis]PPB63344.1 hypothetical protein CDQ73_05700 [Campylobacter hyointestinalis subsp. hyointestinalis]PPB66524.1 hypothetical protein CDQ75_03520 [Campylobacter hyointestinalis subsp. hyointestinalis]PPB68236.1 hypothetical protein CDQ76_03705 [Camp
MEQAFIVQEVSSEQDYEKQNSKIAIYQDKFERYQITRSKILPGFFIINGNGETDFVNDFIEKFVFSDCIKSFADIESLTVSQEDSCSNLAGKIKSDDLLSIQNENLKEAGLFFAKDIFIPRCVVSLIKISIDGFDETTDSFSFLPDIFPSNAEYKYSITKDSFEATMKLSLERDAAKELIDSFVLKGNVKDKNLTLSINDMYIYEFSPYDIDNISNKSYNPTPNQTEEL